MCFTGQQIVPLNSKLYLKYSIISGIFFVECKTSWHQFKHLHFVFSVIEKTSTPFKLGTGIFLRRQLINIPRNYGKTFYIPIIIIVASV
jgi:hypothetical protein